MRWFIRVSYKGVHELDVYLPVDVEPLSYFDGYNSAIRHMVDFNKEPKKTTLYQGDIEKARTYF